MKIDIAIQYRLIWKTRPYIGQPWSSGRIPACQYNRHVTQKKCKSTTVSRRVRRDRIWDSWRRMSSKQLAQRAVRRRPGFDSRWLQILIAYFIVQYESYVRICADKKLFQRAAENRTKMHHVDAFSLITVAPSGCGLPETFARTRHGFLRPLQS